MILCLIVGGMVSCLVYRCTVWFVTVWTLSPLDSSSFLRMCLPGSTQTLSSLLNMISWIIIMMGARWIKLRILSKSYPAVMDGWRRSVAGILSHAHPSNIQGLLAHAALLCNETVFDHLVNIFSLTYGSLVIQLKHAHLLTCVLVVVGSGVCLWSRSSRHVRLSIALLVLSHKSTTIYLLQSNFWRGQIVVIA